MVQNFCFIVCLFSLCFHDHFNEKSGVMKSLTITALVAMCALSFSKVYFMSVNILAFGGKMFKNESSS